MVFGRRYRINVRRVVQLQNDDIGNKLPKDEAESTQFGHSLLIQGHGLKFDTTHFILDSGPLFSFKTIIESNDTNYAAQSDIRTILSSSRLLNVTSVGNTQIQSGRMMGSEVKQTVIGCSVSSCTNHDSGTTFLSPNWGGSLACHNTSFSSCVRTSNAIIGQKHQNITQSTIGRTVVLASSSVTAVTFTLCTFNSMSIASGSSFTGAAINLHDSSSTLTIHQCFFHNCVVSGAGDDGGAIGVKEPKSGLPILITSSSFTDCKNTGTSGNYAGSMFINTYSPTTLSDCFFLACSSYFDGAATLVNNNPAILSNCAFDSCSSVSYAGALGMMSVSRIDLSYLQFRACTSANMPQMNDMYFESMAQSLITASTVRSCDSSSGRPNVFCFIGLVDLSSLVPPLASTPAVTASVSFSGDKATVTASTSTAISGTVGIVLIGSNVPRLVYAVFGNGYSPSTTATAIVSSGPNGVLPSTTYTTRTISFAGVLLRPSVQSATSTLHNANTTLITIAGSLLVDGSYSMLVSSVSGSLTIPLTFVGSTTLTATAPLYPSSASGRLEWGTLHTVERVFRTSGSDHIDIARLDVITFTTPSEPARITSVSCSLNGPKTVLVVELGGVKLTSLGQTVVLAGTSSQVSSSGVIFNVTSTKCLANFSIGSAEDGSHVVSGRQYTLSSVGSGSSSFVVNSGLTLTVPQPPRITKITPPPTASSSFVLSLEGTKLPSGETFNATLTSGHSFSVTFSSTSAGTSSSINIGQTGGLSFNTEYTIKSIIRAQAGKDDEHVLMSASTFKAPDGPTLTLVSCGFNSTDPNFVVVTLTTRLMPLVTFTLRVKTTTTPARTVDLPINFISPDSGQVNVEVYNRTNTLEYGREYSIDSLFKSDLNAGVSAKPFYLPPSPTRIESADCLLGGVKEKSGIVVLNGVNLGGGKQFTITVRKLEGSTPTGSEIPLSGTLSGGSSSTTHSLSIPIFGENNPRLSFETKYRITTFSVDGAVSALNKDVNFTVPSEPSRLMQLDQSLKYSSDEKTATVFLSGIGLSGEYEVTLSVNGSISHTIQLNATFKSNSEGTMVGILFDASSPALVDLAYSTTYEVVDLTGSAKVHVEDGLIFTTITEPPRLLKIDVDDFIDEKKTTISLSFTSVCLQSNSPVSMILESVHSDGTTPHQRTIILETDENGVLGTHHAQLYPIEVEPEKLNSQLEFGTKYKITSLMKEVQPIHFEKETTIFVVPPEPARVEACSDRKLNLARTELIVSLDGRSLKTGLGHICLSNGSSVWKSVVPIKIEDETRCSARFLVGSLEDTDHLEFGKQYTLQEMGDDSSGFVVNDGITVHVPHPPRLTSIDSQLNKQQTSCIIRLTGTNLVAGTEYDLILNSLTLRITFKTTTMGESSEVSIGRKGPLDYSTTYTLTSISPVNVEDGDVLIDSPLSFTTEDHTNKAVIVAEGGSNDTELCGSTSTPCRSVLDGFIVLNGQSGDELTMKILKEAGFGGRINVGEVNLTICGLFDDDNVLIVEETINKAPKEEGVVHISGGSFHLFDVALCLPQVSSMEAEKKPKFVISGFGSCLVERVVVRERWKGEGIGLGIVEWSGGSLSLFSIQMKSIWMGSERSLVKGSSTTNELSFELKNSIFDKVNTTNSELIVFSSTSESSHFEMWDCAFLSAKRIETTKHDDRVGVILVQTRQLSTEVQKCVFEDCGTLNSASSLTLNGGGLIVEIGSEGKTERRTVWIQDCLFIDKDSLWLESGGVIVQSSGKCYLRIDLSGSWFEDTTLTSLPLLRDRFGIPFIERKRKIVHSQTPNTPTAVLVVYGSLLPTISRRGSSFSSCSLRMMETHTTTSS
ncbi:hypothetical protein BLNAU_22673 [Blattamonas nauphoetae]|uniref:Uncharacterized protein n=1 Tax=Blattamonas nauphoetae TaxID=2049346 RepID=A0ABQ9WSE0_9EUKA|nr:hypothetical protein BLNAU_22673 [Blattamonas nauphoetae]